MATRNPDRFTHLESVVAAKLRPRVVQHEGRPDRPPLFFLGGSDQMAGRLGPDQSVVSFGVWSVLHDKPAIGLLVEHYLGEVRKIQPHGPYLLGGFCFWGLVAYEVACRLAAAGEAVPLLCLVEAGFPSKAFARLQPLRRTLLALRRPDVVIRRIARRRNKPGESGTAATLERNYLELLRKALRGYSPSRYPGCVTLICADQSAGRFFPAVGWKSHVGGGIDVQIARGEHLKLFENDTIFDILKVQIESSTLATTKSGSAPACR